MATQPITNAGSKQPAASYLADGRKPVITSTGLALGASLAQDPLAQRIFDTGVAGYVYYVKNEVDTNPAPGETSPNHTNNLVAATHEIL